MAITFSQTARDVVAGAMRDRGLIALDEQPEAAELEYGLVQLDLMLKDLAVEGVTPWSDEETTVVVPAATSTVTLVPRPVDVLEARLVVGTNYQRPLTRWNAGEYDMLPNKAQTGEPLSYEVIHTATDVKIRLWPVPVAEQTIAYSYSRVIEDVEAGTVLDVPQMWGDAIRAMLQARLFAYGEIPPSVTMRAQMLKQQLLDFDRPESYFIEPDRHV